MSVRKTSVAGTFYPNSCLEINKYIEHFNGILEDVDFCSDIKVRAIISPHAGYVYSGFTANFAFNLIQKNKPKRVIVIGPSHRVYINGASIALYDEYETPCGNLKVDLDYSIKLKEEFDFLTFDESAHSEHSTETQMPFIKHCFEQTRVIEIVYGDINYQKISELIDELLKDEDNLIVISTDLSHFYTLKEANVLDQHCIDAIESLNISEFDSGGEACGMIGVKAIINSAVKNSFRSKIVDYRTSFDASSDEGSVVGYVSALIGK